VHGVVGLPSPPLSSASEEAAGNHCLAREMQRVVRWAAKSVTMDGADLGAFGACWRVVELVLAKAVCAVRVC
ncbi:hypothetical protein B0H14DRAFT_2187550, partial [Mycena olivaceomarginata]